MNDGLLLAAIRDARQRKEQADRQLRLVVAYAREVVTPRPYRLADLAEASGMSICGVRIAYMAADVTYPTELLAARYGPECKHGTSAD